MNKKLLVLAMSLAVVGMGIAMPQCPGEKAMQDQIDQLKATQITMTQKLTALDKQVKDMSANSEKANQAIISLGAAVDAQKGALERLNASVTELQSRASAPTGKGKGKKKGR